MAEVSFNTIAFFNNKGGVGKTTLVYHLANMLASRGESVVVADFDPQANATEVFVDEVQRVLFSFEEDDGVPKTIYDFVSPILKGTGDVLPANGREVTENLTLIPGDLRLSLFEDKVSDAWPRCNDNDEAAFRAVTALFRCIESVAQQSQAEWVLIDVGPNLGALNRAALIAADFIVVPVGPDLFSLQGLENLGPTLVKWRAGWNERRLKAPPDLKTPRGEMLPLGYVVMQHGIRDRRPPKAYQQWIDKFPRAFQEHLLQGNGDPNKDYCLATIKHYRSLMPMAMQARKPIFELNPADGAIGAHYQSVLDAKKDFESLCDAMLRRVDEVRAENPL
jgi:chromosome partitioning protein